MTTDDNEYSGKRVLVTGGSKGLGLAIATRFARAGAEVIVGARSAPPETLNATYVPRTSAPRRASPLSPPP